MHTDWSTDWSRGLTAIGTYCQHMTCGHTRSACPSSSSPHHSYLCPPSLPLLPLFELQGSLGSGPAGLLLDRGAGLWRRGGVGTGAVGVGGAVGGGAVVVTEGPGESEDMRRVPVNIQ